MLSFMPMVLFFKFSELFPFMSAFFTTYKCFRIMEARGKELTRGDIFKIIVRKFLRLAPAYYICWLILYVMTSRMISGPVAYNAVDKNMHDCDS
jgi:peptidoglycan/LPS O-acetylase OafA/YrhL